MSVERLELCGGRATVYVGDVRAGLAAMPERSVQCCVTSPPYYALRDYGVDGQIGLEETPEAFIAALVEVFRGVRRVLRDDGVCFVNMGDSYFGGDGRNRNCVGDGVGGGRTKGREPMNMVGTRPTKLDGYKPKDLCGIPWRLAFALQADGWYLRSDIIWAKPNPMPESVTDRPTKSHEYIFLLTKSARYFWDAEGVKEGIGTAANAQSRGPKDTPDRGPRDGGNSGLGAMALRMRAGDVVTRNIRTVWQIATQAYPGSHFATFPEAIPERCIKAGTSERGCCPECGEPWVRETSTTREHGGSKWAPNDGNRAALGDVSATSVFRTGLQTLTRTVGWRPNCDCWGGDDQEKLTPHEPVPCRVLDPFLGSGTTVAVALKLGRHGVGCELNPKYVELARERIGLAAGPSTYQSPKVVDAPLFVGGGNE